MRGQVKVMRALKSPGVMPLEGERLLACGRVPYLQRPVATAADGASGNGSRGSRVSSITRGSATGTFHAGEDKEWPDCNAMSVAPQQAVCPGWALARRMPIRILRHS